MATPSRGEIWFADLNPTSGREQAGWRPVLVVSADIYNHGPSGLVVVLPLTSRLRDIAIRVRLRPPEGGLKVESDILCDEIRTVSRERLDTHWGAVADDTLALVAARLRALLALMPPAPL